MLLYVGLGGYYKDGIGLCVAFENPRTYKLVLIAGGNILFVLNERMSVVGFSACFFGEAYLGLRSFFKFVVADVSVKRGRLQ